jgi:hypothetical protein
MQTIGSPSTINSFGKLGDSNGDPVVSSTNVKITDPRESITGLDLTEFLSGTGWSISPTSSDAGAINTYYYSPDHGLDEHQSGSGTVADLGSLGVGARVQISSIEFQSNDLADDRGVVALINTSSQKVVSSLVLDDNTGYRLADAGTLANTGSIDFTVTEAGDYELRVGTFHTRNTIGSNFGDDPYTVFSLPVVTNLATADLSGLNAVTGLAGSNNQDLTAVDLSQLDTLDLAGYDGVKVDVADIESSMTIVKNGGTYVVKDTADHIPAAINAASDV